MATNTELNSLVERLRNDSGDREGNPHSWGLAEYLEELINDGNLDEEEAVGSAKQAISQGFNSLTERQLKEIAENMLKNMVYMEECPNEWCGERIAWGDMHIALDEGKCYHCVNQEEAREQD